MRVKIKSGDGTEALFKSHGITSAATYDTVPLEIEVGALSSSSRRYLDLLTKLDQLMPLLQTLGIHEVISPQAVDSERAVLKRKARDVANGACNLATRLRREMNALDARSAAGPVSVSSDEHSRNIDAATAALLASDEVIPAENTPVSDDDNETEPEAGNGADAQPGEQIQNLSNTAQSSSPKTEATIPVNPL